MPAACCLLPKPDELHHLGKLTDAAALYGGQAGPSHGVVIQVTQPCILTVSTYRFSPHPLGFKCSPCCYFYNKPLTSLPMLSLSLSQTFALLSQTLVISCTSMWTRQNINVNRTRCQELCSDMTQGAMGKGTR